MKKKCQLTLISLRVNNKPLRYERKHEIYRNAQQKKVTHAEMQMKFSRRILFQRKSEKS